MIRENTYRMLNNLLAQDFNLKATGQFSEVAQFTLPQIIAGIIQLVMVIAALIFFFMLVIGGVKWIASGGDKGQTEGARNQITAALVGLVIVFAAWAIANLVGYFFGGLDILNLKPPQIGSN